VIKRDPPVTYVGAVVVGNGVKQFAEDLMKPLGVRGLLRQGRLAVSSSAPCSIARC
jgi:hypothetical protein